MIFLSVNNEFYQEKLDFAEKEKKILKENDFESPAILNIEFVDNQQENIKVLLCN